MSRRAWSVTISFVALALLALPAASSRLAPTASGWKVVAWNDLGMHCMDSDYSVFSILPPFNVVHAQVIDANGDLVTSDAGLSLTYEATPDPAGSINATSIGKTDYWTHATALYGASSTPDTGLLGFDMPGPANLPQSMAFDAAVPEWAAPGIPITPYDDDGHKRPYPMLRVVARDAAGQLLASSTPVVPVSDEMDCRLCHGSGAGPDAQPASGWVNDRHADHDYRLNVLKLHDEMQAGDATYASALAAAGYHAAGLHHTATAGGTPILCARCHASNALPGTGISGISSLTAAVHGMHAGVTDPENGLTLDASTNRASCYRCHPGSETRCLRGAMGAAVASDGSLAMQCQSCHGGMSQVGDAARVGWLDQPNCQACHTGTATRNNGQIRYTDALEPGGSLRVAVDATFATQADVPAPGFSLYRFSSGHGGLRCEACHGSTHAEYPAAHPNDNVVSIDLQAHVGVISECTACHAQTPITVDGGPHGMHPVGQEWVDAHPGVVDDDGAAQCEACHGTDYRGTVLSRMQADRDLSHEDVTLSFFRGQEIGCYACHLGPDDESFNPNRRPVASDASGTCSDQPVTIGLAASDADGDPLTLRIVRQPSFGRVGLSGTQATYIPDPGFAGVDTFTFTASDGSTDGSLGTVSVTRQATWGLYGSGFPGTAGVVPAIALDADPQLGGDVSLQVQNVAGHDTLMVVLAATEPARIDTNKGGVLLAELLLVFAAPLPQNGADLGWSIPNDPAFTGLSIYTQVLEADSGARWRIAFSRGVRMTLGP